MVLWKNKSIIYCNQNLWNILGRYNRYEAFSCHCDIFFCNCERSEAISWFIRTLKRLLRRASSQWQEDYDIKTLILIPPQIVRSQTLPHLSSVPSIPNKPPFPSTKNLRPTKAKPATKIKIRKVTKLQSEYSIKILNINCANRNKVATLKCGQPFTLAKYW